MPINLKYQSESVEIVFGGGDLHVATRVDAYDDGSTKGVVKIDLKDNIFTPDFSLVFTSADQIDWLVKLLERLKKAM